MGERKVLNKYFPPDFDPSKVPRGKRVRSEDKQMKVRMMLPMSVRCNTCGNFMYKGTKFNTRMEDVRGEDYLGIKIFRFYYKCTNCGAEFCMKTDPKNTDYVVEGGATRNYEPWRDKERAVQDAKSKREEEERGDAMKALENKTLDSRREMDILTALDEMKSLKARHEGVNLDNALAALQRAGEEEGKTIEEYMDEEDEREVQRMLMEQAGLVKRISDDDSSEDEVGHGGVVEGNHGSFMASTHVDRNFLDVHKAKKRHTMAEEAWDEEVQEETEEGDIWRQQDAIETTATEKQKGSIPSSAHMAGNGASPSQPGRQKDGPLKTSMPTANYKSVPSFGGMTKTFLSKSKRGLVVKHQKKKEDATQENQELPKTALVGLNDYGSDSSS